MGLAKGFEIVGGMVGVQPKTAAALGMTAVIGVPLGAGIDTARYLENITHTEVVVNGGHGYITEVERDLTPSECMGGYTVRVDGAYASTTKYIGPVATTYNAWAKYNGEAVAHVCNADSQDKAKYHVKIYDDDQVDYPGQNRHISVSLTADAFSETVYPKNPMDEQAWTTHKDILASLSSMWDDLKNTPTEDDIASKVPTSTDKMMTRLQGWTWLAVVQTVSKSCGNKAWELLRPLYKDAIVAKVVSDNNQYVKDEKYKITTNNVDVELPKPDEIQLHSQYDSMIQTIKQETEKKNYKTEITFPDPSRAKCTPDKNVKVG